MDTNPYRELATISPLTINPIQAEFDRINSILEKKIEEKVERILRYMTKQYLNKPRDSGWYVMLDPGAHWWNRKKYVTRAEFSGTFGKRMRERCEELNIKIDDAINPSFFGSNFVMYWKFK